MKITVGIPAYNEEKNIASIIIKLKKISDQIIVCNDGSTDATAEIAEGLGAIVINHPKNLGYGAGINSILNFDNVEFYTDDAVKFVKNVNEKFELVILSSVLHQIYANMNGADDFLSNISKTTNA